ncbi:MAG: N-acetylmuramic acid 6-phosphate etherase [Clostridia bacterium]|nr:N-acetylmuramic acid 6-phosphate etherase [Clostridia bacterium]MBQ4638384.1 N-acetylmuramic acid 6-phosphate etherase [Clostridia bacterium]
MLKTEQRNSNTTHIDKMTALEMAEVMQKENVNAALAVEAALPDIAKAIDEVSKRMENKGRLFYIGCGTSGRLGVLDASECPPTYGVSPDLVVGIIAGGDKALRNAVEKIEDNYDSGKSDLAAHSITKNDSVVGISVAGGASYVVGALEYAKSRGALTLSLSCNENSRISQISDISIITDTGAEVVTGSTRMKAGTAHKMVLNMLSTGVMIKLGRVYENYMVHIKPVNAKLKDRMIRIVSEIAGVDKEQAELMLEANSWVIVDAIEKGTPK